MTETQTDRYAPVTLSWQNVRDETLREFRNNRILIRLIGEDGSAGATDIQALLDMIKPTRREIEFRVCTSTGSIIPVLAVKPEWDGRKLICFDFDGVLHSYTSRWSGPGVISDPPVEGAIEYLIDLIDNHGDRFKVAIYSARSSFHEGRVAMRKWLAEEIRKRTANNMAQWDIINFIDFPDFKPPAHITIDDRAFGFCGQFPPIEALEDFKPWNK